tara:strand:+ start:311 stop:487 length:177 start_codon:yes stop_codon:yes gene_type:complete
MINEKLAEIIDILQSSAMDAEKSEDGNISAGRRVRKNSMTAIKELKELRALILEHQRG